MAKWIAGAVVALVIVVGGGWWGLRYYGQQSAERRFDAMIKPILPAGPEHGAVRYAAAGDRLEVDDIVAKDEASGLKSIRIAHTTATGASAPRLESLRLEKVVLEGAEGDHVEIDEVTAGGVELASLARTPGAAAATSTAPPVESLGIVGLKAHSGQFDSAVGKLSFSGLKTPLPAKGAGIDELRAWLARLEFEKAEIADLELRAIGGDSGHATLHRLAISGVAPGKVNSVALEGLSIEAKGGVGFKLGSVDIAGVAYRPRSEGAKAAAALLGLPGAGWLPGRVFFERFALGEATVAAPGGGDVTLKEIRSAMTGTLAQATGFDFQVKEFSITRLPALPFAFDPADLGLSRLVLNIDARSTYDPATQRLEIPRYAFVLPKLGSLTLSASLGGIAPDEGGDDPMVAMQRILTAELRRFEIRYDDDSLVRRLMEIAAKQQNSDIETVRSGLIAQVELQKASLSDNPALAEMLNVVIAFLKDPHNLTIVLEPPKPLPLATFTKLSGMAPNELQALLGLSVK